EARSEFAYRRGLAAAVHADDQNHRRRTGDMQLGAGEREKPFDVFAEARNDLVARAPQLLLGHRLQAGEDFRGRGHAEVSGEQKLLELFPDLGGYRLARPAQGLDAGQCLPRHAERGPELGKPTAHGPKPSPIGIELLFDLVVPWPAGRGVPWREPHFAAVKPEYLSDLTQLALVMLRRGGISETLSRLKSELSTSPEPFVWASLGLRGADDLLPPEIRSAWLFALKAEMWSGLHHHPNSVQHTIVVSGQGRAKIA